MSNSPPICPAHNIPITRILSHEDVLIFPLHKRSIVQYETDAKGNRELFLFYGDKEISFDEPELFAFGEKLTTQAQFVAQSALSWGEGYTWPQIQELLSLLLDEGILHYADSYTETDGQPGDCPSPLLPAATTEAQTWINSEVITQVLTGRKLELGYLELVIPIFRVAHIALDAEGRQVGEANVFPKALRLDIPTNWRTCIYPGSRYLDSRPMNVTALKSMRAYWSQIMVALLHIRDAYVQRFPAVQQGWTLGDVEALSSLVLALPTYLLMREQQRVENGQLHPVLSCMFRVTDGLRMVSHQMIFVPLGEPTISPKAPITTAEIYTYAERNYSFSSDHGVCAGPKMMIDEFMNVLVNGIAIKDAASVQLDAAVLEALNTLPQVLDYGLYGLQAHAVIFAIWPLMTRTYAELALIVELWEGSHSEALLAWRERLRHQLHILQTQTYHAKEEWRVTREQAYAEIYHHCAKGLKLPENELDLAVFLEPEIQIQHIRVRTQLRDILHKYCTNNAPDFNEHVNRLVTCLMHFFERVQSHLRVACTIQTRINTLLEREAPQHPFAAADIDIHNLLQGPEAKKLPYLLDELESMFDIQITLNKDELSISEAIRPS